MLLWDFYYIHIILIPNRHQQQFLLAKIKFCWFIFLSGNCPLKMWIVCVKWLLQLYWWKFLTIVWLSKSNTRIRWKAGYLSFLLKFEWKANSLAFAQDRLQNLAGSLSNKQMGRRWRSFDHFLSNSFVQERLSWSESIDNSITEPLLRDLIYSDMPVH